MAKPVESQTFRPALTSRKGEIGSWVSFFIAVFSGWVLLRQGSSLVWFIALFAALFLFVAIGTTLANWMERKTILTIQPEGVFFTNGLRRVFLKWEEIKELRILPARWGNSVHVIGDQAHFHYLLGGQVSVMGRGRERIGFTQGEQILKILMSRTGLTPLNSSS
jgi:hypothetical protein